jgi:hypothetical protein
MTSGPNHVYPFLRLQSRYFVPSSFSTGTGYRATEDALYVTVAANYNTLFDILSSKQTPTLSIKLLAHVIIIPFTSTFLGSQISPFCEKSRLRYSASPPLRSANQPPRIHAYAVHPPLRRLRSLPPMNQLRSLRSAVLLCLFC